MSFLQLVLSLDKDDKGNNSILKESVNLTDIATMINVSEGLVKWVQNEALISL